LVSFNAHALTSAMSAVLLTWPACYIVHLLLELNFGLQLVHDNAPLLTLVVPHIALALAMLWDTAWKQNAFVAVDSWLDRALASRPSLCPV
jgi:ABC-type spermidine/putrescine transport system permease subunit II